MTRNANAAAGKAVRAEDRFDGRTDALAERIEDVQSRLHRLELETSQLGVAVAPLYLASARGSLRHVTDCLVHHLGGRYADAAMPEELCPGTSLRLLPVAGRDGIGARYKVAARGRKPAPGADVDAWARRPDLGAALLASPEAAAICRGPVGAALMFDALARHRWMHGRSAAKWSTDVSGAHALVSALADGCGFPHPGPTATAGLVDGEVVDLLASLGWLRVVSTRMPGQAA